MNGNRIQIVRPWNIQDASGLVGTGTVFPVEISPPEGDNRQVIAKWFGVQKLWRLHGTTVGWNGDPSLTVGIAEKTFFSEMAKHSNERAIIQELFPTQSIFGLSDEFSTPTDDSSEAMTFSLKVGYYGDPSINGTPSVGLTHPTPSTPILWPYVTLAVNVAGLEMSSFDGANLRQTGVTVSFHGYSVDMYSRADLGDHWTGTITIGAPDTDGYFEYRDKNGLNPVWDKDTGAQLISPSPLT